ncbi:hypothetical protein V6N13_043630 [Hibiscus sabdariffa]|uniref:RING-type E3 ubiquitin transferase n=1 Tax=Hibiscus sabdariffa TaxID=183260 RepID=A0ABR2RG23_9ROSI
MSIHTNEAVVLLSLICTLVSSLGLFCIVKCANREGGSTSVAAEPGVSSSPKLPNLGVEQEALNAFPVLKYATRLELPGLDAACVICLSEFAAGECLRILPKCNHGFHTRCIDTWLASHSSCPTCRHCLIETNMINMKSLHLVETVN